MMFFIPFIMFNPYLWLIALAVLPAIVLLVYVYKKDRIEKEPFSLLLILMVAGVAATFFAAATERIGFAVNAVLFPNGGKISDAFLYFVVVAVSEEGFKYIALKNRTWRRPEFNCTFDGVIYAVVVSLGFALWENISYVLSYGMTTAIVRAVTAVPGHACFGVFMGVYYSRAKSCEVEGDRKQCINYRKKAFLVPVLLHGFYDFEASSDADISGLVFLVFIVIMFVSAFRSVKKFSAEDSYIDRNSWEYTAK